MDCYVPCFKFRIRTEEVRHSRPNPLDVFILQYLLRYQTAEGDQGCPLDEFLKAFSFLDESILFGILYKLHINYLTLTRRARLLVNREVVRVMNKTKASDLAEALGCRTGSRQQTYSGYFDLYSGHIFLDRGYTMLTGNSLRGKVALKEHFPSLRVRNPQFFSPGARLAIINEILRQRLLPDGDYYEAESASIDLLSTEEEPLRFLPLLLGQGRVPHAGRELPDELLLKIAGQMRKEGLFAEAGELQAILGAGEPSDEESTAYAQRDGFCEWCSFSRHEDLRGWMEAVIENVNWLTITQALADLLSENCGSEEFARLVASTLDRGISVRILGPSKPGRVAQFCLASKNWVESRAWVPEPLLIFNEASDKMSYLLPYALLEEAARGGDRLHRDAVRHLRRGDAAKPILYFIPTKDYLTLPPLLFSDRSFDFIETKVGGDRPWIIEHYSWRNALTAVIPTFLEQCFGDFKPVEELIIPPGFRMVPNLTATSPTDGASSVVCTLAGKGPLSPLSDKQRTRTIGIGNIVIQVTPTEEP